ncbi:hypothetical protein ELQ35_03815 [Peribacillus cavernae]|uniref:YwmB family TATA-box binding protein n=1 Tax=Peribacillus cavernae TaxID=1674310 RepID=A0A3S0VRZ2_9BACI|nr:YwmB family TATA-box binding protein [Peribacillus cavernae]MDQ0218490.1 hypothetical protein [Peribacillus cavernae]RUQ31484.1 hypothetical protein ELQ35_03815 [Peribacillus cavernae]
MKNKMRKLLPYIALISFIGLMFGNSTIVAKSKADIVTMTELLQHDKNVNIEEWSVYAREKNSEIRNENDLNKAVRKLREVFPRSQWEIEKQGNEWKAHTVFTNVDTGLTESINLMMTHEKTEPVSYIIYEVKGRLWDNRYSSFFENAFQNRIKDIFRGNPSIFSCIKGVFNGNIDTVLSKETARLLDLFQAQEMESIEEKNFKSVSAQTALFDQTFTNEPLNLQLAMRTEGLGEKTAFVVGTPIITIEY